MVEIKGEIIPPFSSDDRDAFYEAAGKILGVEQSEGITLGRGRWRRGQGRGRFEDRGVIRYFSPTLIQILLTKPSLSGIFRSADEALEAIRKAVNHGNPND